MTCVDRVMTFMTVNPHMVRRVIAHLKGRGG